MKTHEIHCRPGMAPAWLAIACLFISIPRPAAAQAGELSGTWSGTGRVVLTTGDTERARCRATFAPQGSRFFAMSAVCATPSARFTQTARVRQVSPDAYEGQFYNREYDISGAIWITLRGNRLSASLTGGGATGTLSLGR